MSGRLSARYWRREAMWDAGFLVLFVLLTFAHRDWQRWVCLAFAFLAANSFAWDIVKARRAALKDSAP